MKCMDTMSDTMSPTIKTVSNLEATVKTPPKGDLS